MIRVRFAPSPTGNLHIGTVRTALFNWLFSRAVKGTLVIRIEDTDQARSERVYEDSIMDGLNWLGIPFDEGPSIGGPFGPYRQSERMATGIYQEWADRLVNAHNAYPCFCTEADLDDERKVAMAAKRPYVYSRKCFSRSPEEIAHLLATETPHTLRLKMPDAQAVEFEDLIRGPISFESDLVGDFVLMKSDGGPSYNFAVVVDDISMRITHVIRGEDHISNTPKQMTLFRAFDSPVPAYGHLPMILGADKSKLSKRHGATNVVEYREKGILPEAFLNYLTLLGWSHPDDLEIFSPDDVRDVFSLARISKSGAVFDEQKLRWMNGQYIRGKPASEIFELTRPYMDPTTLTFLESLAREQAEHLLGVVKDGLTVLSDINGVLSVWTRSRAATLEKRQAFEFLPADREVLDRFLTLAKDSPTWSASAVHTLIQSILNTTGLGRGKVLKPLRLAVTGEGSGPDLNEVLGSLGQTEVVARLASLL